MKRDGNLLEKSTADLGALLVSFSGRLTFTDPTGCVEYVDEISLAGRAVFVPWSVSQAQHRADGGWSGARGLIFIRSADLCHDAFKHPTNLTRSSSLHNEWVQTFKNKTKAICSG